MKVISKQFINESINDKYLFKSVFMAGGGGSGKGWVSNNFFGMNKEIGDSPFGVKVVNSDIAFEYLIKKNNLPMVINAEDKNTFDKQMVQRELAKAMTNKRMSYFMEGMLPIIIDGTAKDYDKIKKQKLAFEGFGYDTAMVFVNTSLEVAQKRNLQRERKIDPSMIESMWHDVQQNIGKFQNLFNDGFIIIDNSKEYTKEDTHKIILEMFKKGERLLAAPLKNFKGRTILDTLRSTGGKYLSDFEG